MAADMKKTISEAAKRLLLEKNRKKITVTDIVEECQITRQAFYYHFEDIVDLLKWTLGCEKEQMLEKLRSQEDAEEGLRNFFLIAVQLAPYIKKGMDSNYRDEIERLLVQAVYDLGESLVEKENLYADCSRAELKLILRYHSQAVMGILRWWTQEDTQNLDWIVHQIYLIMTGKRLPSDHAERGGE